MGDLLMSLIHTCELNGCCGESQARRAIETEVQQAVHCPQGYKGSAFVETPARGPRGTSSTASFASQNVIGFLSSKRPVLERKSKAKFARPGASGLKERR
jgi:hypothetical protein